VTAKGPQWAEQELRLEDVRVHPDFQFRAKGIEPGHVKKLRRLLEADKPLPRVRVARVGKALYLVDGYHRLEAHRAAGRKSIGAEVARMSLGAAREEARLANARHGKSLSRADRAAIWDDYLAHGRHLGPFGLPKSPRAIEAELEGTYSRETVRKKLRAMGLEPDEPDLKPWRGREEPDEATLYAERMEDAEWSLRHFTSLVLTLDDDDRAQLLRDARESLGRLERGEALPEPQPETVGDDAARLGI